MFRLRRSRLVLCRFGSRCLCFGFDFSFGVCFCPGFSSLATQPRKVRFVTAIGGHGSQGVARSDSTCLTSVAASSYELAGSVNARYHRHQLAGYIPGRHPEGAIEEVVVHSQLQGRAGLLGALLLAQQAGPLCSSDVTDGSSAESLRSVA